MRLETGGLRVYGPRSPVREAFRLSSFSADGTCAQPPAPAMANLNTGATRDRAAAVLAFSSCVCDSAAGGCSSCVFISCVCDAAAAGGCSSCVFISCVCDAAAGGCSSCVFQLRFHPLRV